MQMQLPIFPENTKLINGCVGFYKQDDFVYYLHNGSPIFCHHKDSIDNFKYIIANLVGTGLCTPGELSNALGVPHRNVNRYTKKLIDEGMESFFQKTDRRGQCYQLTDDKKHLVQELLNNGYSNVKAGKEIGVSEGTIRYHIKHGNLFKKKQKTDTIM
jgi:hypothetical protein